MTAHIAVIGAGIAGAAAANVLTNAGHAVTVFEKARGPGGRMASRRITREPDAPTYDHGCQMLSAEAELNPAQPWAHRLAAINGTEIASIADRTRPVPIPRMNAPAASLLEGISASFGTRVTRIENKATSVAIQSQENHLGRFDALIITAPAPQTQDLLTEAAPSIARGAASARYAPCWTLMLERPADAEPLSFDAAEVTSHPVAWLCHDSTKPGRDASGTQRWIAQFAADFSMQTIDESPDDIAPTLRAAARDHLGESTSLAQPPHRWRYAFVTRAAGEPCLTDGRIVAAGDWLLGDRAHHAAQSGRAAARAVVAMLA